MIGLMSFTVSPSSVVSSRSTPWVAGWCGPDVDRQELVLGLEVESSPASASVP